MHAHNLRVMSIMTLRHNDKIDVAQKFGVGGEAET